VSRRLALVAGLALALAGCALEVEPEPPYVAVRTRDLRSRWGPLQLLADHAYVVWRRAGEASATLAERNFGGVDRYGASPWGRGHATHALLTGDAARAAIARLERATTTDRAADEATYGEGYLAWPGPNSNSYVAALCRKAGVPVDLPPTAVGQDWPDLVPHLLGVGPSTTGLGVRLDLLGVVGVGLGLVEGVEVHLLGTTLGVAFWPPALKLPFAPRIGF